MAASLADKVLGAVHHAKELYHRLVLAVAPSGSGKTEALRDVAERTGARFINLNLALSSRMLDLTERERKLRLPDLLKEVVGKDEPLVLKCRRTCRGSRRSSDEPERAHQPSREIRVVGHRVQGGS